MAKRKYMYVAYRTDATVGSMSFICKDGHLDFAEASYHITEREKSAAVITFFAEITQKEYFSLQKEKPNET